ITQMEAGINTVCFSTGMAALSATFLTLLRQGDHVIASNFIFGNTNSFLGTLMRLGVQVSFVDATDVEAVKAAYQSNTRLVFVESIANPATQIADLEPIGQWCKQKGLLYVLDNTLSTPWLCQGRSVQAGLVVNS